MNKNNLFVISILVPPSFCAKQFALTSQNVEKNIACNSIERSFRIQW